jgi:Carboxypeptidase regulatory-like domain
MRPTVIVLALAILTDPSGAIRAAEISVVDVGGAPVGDASLVCIDPASDVPVRAAEGRATVTAPCRRLRCAASDFLPGEVDVSGETARCVLRPGTRIAGDVPATAAAAGLEARLYSSATAPVGTIAIPKALAGKPLAPFAFPLVKPGRYALELARKSDGWTCRADLGPLGPGRRAVGPAWREPSALSVSVKGADGNPAAAVPVRTWSGRPAPDRHQRGVAPIGAWACAPAPGTKYQTDTSGVARLPVDTSMEMLVLAGDWKDPRGLAYTVLARAPSQAIPLTLAAAVRVRAKVEDDKNRPVACDALLTELPADLSWLVEAAPGATIKTACDAQGVFAFGPLAATASILEVRPRSGLPMRIQVDAPAPGATADLGVLRVRGGESIRVVVQDDSGRPVPQAKVTARGSAGIVLTVAGTTGDDGAVDLSGIPKNATIGIDVKAKGFLPARESGLELDAGPFVVRLARGASISGKVRDADGGPIQGARVSLTAERNEAPVSATADADGAFELEGVDDGQWRVMATAAGFAPSEAATVELRDHRPVSGLTLTLAPTHGIYGRVVDSGATPAAGARVRLVESRDRDDAAPIAEALTGADGAFQLQAAAPPDSWLVATKPGSGPCALRAPDEAARAGEVVLALTEPAALIVHLAKGARTTRNLVVKDGAGIGRAVAVAGMTEFSFADLAPGRGSARLAGSTDHDVALAPRETADVTLEAAAAVEGRVSFEGNPAARARVQVVEVSTDGSRLNEGGGSFTDERGRYRIDGFAGGSYRIVAVGEDGRAEAEFNVADGETAAVDLALRSVRLVVTVVDGATEKPVAGISVSAAPGGKTCNSMMGTSSSGDPGDLGFEVLVGSNGCLSSQTNAAGLARLSLATPGSYDLSIGDTSYEPWTQSVAIGDGTTAKRISLTRKPDHAGDKPHVFANLRTDPAGLSGTIECIGGGNTNSSSPVVGRADCGTMIPGPGEVVFHVEGYGRGRTAFDVPQTGEMDVDVDVPRGGTVVVPISQEPAAQPVLVDASGFAWSDPKGTGRTGASLEDLPNIGRAWVFRDMPPGTYAVTLDGKSRSPVPLASGGTAVAY